MITEAIIQRIAALTEENDHNEALRVAAEALGHRRIKKIMENVQRIAYFEGYMPHPLIQYREEVRRNLMEYARETWSQDDVDRLKRAF